MKKKLRLLIFTFFIFFAVNSQTTKKVLFIGNSYTNYNNLPLMISNMASSTGDVLIYDSNTPGGYRFMNHATNATTLAKINSNTWDYVSLQAQSQETSWDQSQMQLELYPYATTLCNAIRANNECSQPLFYMTWGRQNGDASNCSILPWVCTYEGMDDAIQTTYTYMADTNNAEVAPVGALWRHLRTNYPTLNLYDSDGSHPSLIGSYAAACAFYTMIYKKDPTLITWNSTISASDASIIKAATQTVVYDVYSNYDFTINPAMSNFTEVTNGSQVTFTNLSNAYDSILWDFGNGVTSVDDNPVYIYPSIGNYSVSLTTTKCGKSHTFTKTVLINSLNTNTFYLENVHVFPNPVIHNLTVKLNKEYHNIQIEVIDISGKTILKHIANNLEAIELDLSSIQSGIYVISIATDNVFYVSKISKH